MVQKSNRIKVRRKGLSPTTKLIVIGAVAVYAAWIGSLPNKHYAQVFYHMGNDCEQCPLPEQTRLAEKAIYHDPAFSNGYTRMGYLFEQNDRHAEAVAFHHQALLYDHRNRLSLIELGINSFRQQDMDMALRYLVAANAVTGYGDTLNYYMGRVYERKGDNEKAAWYYLRAYQFNPENMNAFARLGSMELKSGDKKGCLKIAEQIREKGDIALAAQLEGFTKTDGKTEFMASEK